MAWQASTLAVIAALIGLPLGIAAGRQSWSLFADHLGVVSEPRLPFGWLVLVVPVMILLANLIAAVPARVRARTSPALVLP